MSEETRAPVARALSVLEAMNAAHSLHLGDIAERAGLPKSSTVRLLDQLIEAGYVEKLSRSAGYRLTSRVQRLSWGFRLSDAVVEAAEPLMRAFTKEHRWPLFIGVVDGDQMIVRYGTVAESPVAIDPLVYEAPSPFLLGALGQAYLAFCPDWERKLIVARLSHSRRSIDQPAKNPEEFEKILRGIRRRGYALTSGGLRQMKRGMPKRASDARQRVTGMAVPVMRGDRVLACLSLRYMHAVISEQEVAKTHLEPLRELAREIERTTRQMTTAGNGKRE